MRRKLAFSGFILGTVITAITAFFMLIGGIVIIEMLSSVDADAYIAIVVVEVLFFIATLVLNAVSISATTNAKKFDRRKGLVITTIVFNFLAMLVYIMPMTTEVLSTGVIVVYVLLMLALIASNVLAIVDLSLNKKAIKKEENIDKQEIETVKEATQGKDDNLEEEINKLMLMKAKNIITEEEFEALKKHAIEKRL